jgi:hypothetical protein
MGSIGNAISSLFSLHAFNKHLTSKFQFSPNFTLNSVADSNYRGKCDVGGFLIFEWTLGSSFWDDLFLYSIAHLMPL